MNKKVKTKGQIFIKELNIYSFQLWKLKTESKRKVVKAGVTSLGPALQHKTFTCKNAFFDYDDCVPSTSSMEPKCLPIPLASMLILQ